MKETMVTGIQGVCIHRGGGLGIRLLAVLTLLLSFAVESVHPPVAAKADGTQRTGLIAFVHCPGGEPPCDIATIDPGGTIQQLTTGGGSSPLWSPDGSTIAYQSGGETWVVAADGGNPKQLALPSGAFDSWSTDPTVPGGTQMLVSTISQYVLVHLSGLTVTGTAPILSGTRPVEQAVLSPDGTKIAYGLPSFDGKTAGYEAPERIWVTDVDGSDLHAITPVPIDFNHGPLAPGCALSPPSWSPDGRAVLYVNGDPIPGEDFAACQIAVAAADGSGAHDVTDLQPQIGLPPYGTPGLCDEPSSPGWGYLLPCNVMCTFHAAPRINAR